MTTLRQDDLAPAMLLASLVLALCTVLSFAAAPEQVRPEPGSPEPSLWTAVAASGAVSARPPRAAESLWVRVGRGDRLEALSSVRTGQRGRATLVLAGHVLIARPDTEFTLPDTASLDSDPRVRQDSGRITYEVDGSLFDLFEVHTPYLIAGVKGTVFTVVVSETGASVIVDEGEVEVRSPDGGDVVLLHGGEEARMDRAEGSELEVRPADPKLLSETRKALDTARRQTKQAGIDTAALDESEDVRSGDAVDPALDPDSRNTLNDDKWFSRAERSWVEDSGLARTEEDALNPDDSAKDLKDDVRRSVEDDALQREKVDKNTDGSSTGG